MSLANQTASHAEGRRSERRPLSRRGAPALDALLFLLLLAILFANLAWIWVFRADDLGDFGSFLAAGRAAAAGANPYQSDSPLVFHVNLPAYGARVASVNLNPPLSVLLFRPLAGLDPLIALQAWRGISVTLYLTVLFLLLRAIPGRVPPLRIAWALSLAGFWQVVDLGQIYLPLLLAAVGALLLLRSGRQLLAGALIGLLVALKPNFGLWPLFLLLSGGWPAALAALGAAGLLSLLPLAVYGPQIYVQWLQASAAFTAAGLVLPGNSSLAGLLAHLGLPGAGTPLSLALLAALAVWTWRKRLSINQASALALAAALLFAPLAWVGYTVFLLPVLLERPWSWPLRLAAAILVIPFPLVLFGMYAAYTARAAYMIWGWSYGWALALVLLGLLLERSREPHAGAALAG